MDKNIFSENLTAHRNRRGADAGAGGGGAGHFGQDLFQMGDRRDEAGHRPVLPPCFVLWEIPRGIL